MADDATMRLARIPPPVKRALYNYLTDLARVYTLNRVIVFGALAKGKFNQHTPVDIAIFSTDVTDANRLDVIADCLLRTMSYPVVIQPFIYPLSTYEADEDFIKNEIIAQGIEVPFAKQ